MTERLLGLGDDWEAFTVVIQLGAILAVVVDLFPDLLEGAGHACRPRRDARRFALGIDPGAAARRWWRGWLVKKFLDRVLLNPGHAMPVIAATWLAGRHHHPGV